MMADVNRKASRRALAVLIVGGGVGVGVGLKGLVRHLNVLQKQLCETGAPAPPSSTSSNSSTSKVAVDIIFTRRVAKVLHICVPSLLSKEAFYIAVQTCLLYGRTLLTEHIASLEGLAGETVLSKDWVLFGKNLRNIARAAVPAALVNSALKFMQAIISLSFQQRLTEHLHERYLSNRGYYVASTLGGLSNPDQRITEDVAKFSSAISELYSYTFKPVLDIVLFTRSLAKSIGYKGQFLLYAYFILSSTFLRLISPPLALMTAQEAALSGNFRNAHQWIVAHAEEIAFNDPPGGNSEHRILNDHLHRLIRHTRLSAIQKFFQHVADGYLIKYIATAVGLCVYAAPFYFGTQKDSFLKTGEYIRAVRLMTNTSNAIGQLVLIYKRVTSLAGFTSRVSELLESVKLLSSKEGQAKASALKRLSQLDIVSESQNGLTAMSPQLIFGEEIRFKKVTIYSPDGMLLIKELSFEVFSGQSVIIMGPNGSGKSSLLRVLAELWPLQSGIIIRPPRGSILYLSQRPYVVRGSLRDQLRYPGPPLDLLQSRGRNRRSSLKKNHSDDPYIVEALDATEIAYLLERGEGLDQIQNWEETLSGGEKQRLAVARVLYHRPKFAVLDECTSAVSADGEDKLYKELHRHGITLLSIAHRPALKKYHSALLYIDQSEPGLGWRFEKLDV